MLLLSKNTRNCGILVHQLISTGLGLGGGSILICILWRKEGREESSIEWGELICSQLILFKNNPPYPRATVVVVALLPYVHAGKGKGEGKYRGTNSRRKDVSWFELNLKRKE